MPPAALVLSSIDWCMKSALEFKGSVIKVAEGGGTKRVYRYKNSLFQSPFIVYGIFGQLIIILFFLPRQVPYCDYLAICQQPTWNLAGIFFPLSAWIGTWQLINWQMSSEVENWDLLCIVGHGDYAFCCDLTLTLLAIALAKPIELHGWKERLLRTERL